MAEAKFFTVCLRALETSNTLRCIPDVFRESATANHRFHQAHRREATIKQQYDDLENALNEVPVVFAAIDGELAPEIRASIETLLHLQNLVIDKEMCSKRIACNSPCKVTEPATYLVFSS
ncbi:hypothetical protein ACSSS7_005363 [Eimeria intestinalis]